jgi:U4/U6.U5 tri-snRNP-associated protein 2
LDLPPAPLFQDAVEKNIIPQVSIVRLLNKYNGIQGIEMGNKLKRFKVLSLPDHLIFHIKRFQKNNFTVEKNPTIVTFPLKDLNLAPYCEGNVGETRYDLLANIIHEGEAVGGKLKVHVARGDHWYQIQDLIIQDILPQMIFLSESFLQIWKRRQ